MVGLDRQEQRLAIGRLFTVVLRLLGLNILLFLLLVYSMVQVHRRVCYHGWEAIRLKASHHSTVLSQRDGVQRIRSHRLLDERTMHVPIFAPQRIDLQLVVL